MINRRIEETQPLLSLKYGSYSDKGVRRENQDSTLLFHNHILYSFAIADGAGGHRFGKQASLTTVKALEDELKSDHLYSISYLTQLVKNKYNQINQHIYQHGKKTGDVMVTTLSMINILDQEMIISNVGDTKIFRIRNRQIELLSKVHTVAWSQYEQGEITKEELLTHKQKHVLTEGIGGSEKVNPYVATTDVQGGDLYILCSDGVYNFILEEEFISLFNPGVAYTNEELDELCKQCVSLALKNKSDDNLSVIAVQI